MSRQIALGKFGSPYGVRGWVKVVSYTEPPKNILDYQPWYIIRNNQKIVLKNVLGRVHGHQIVVQLGTCHDRDAAKAYTNLEIYVDRSQLPEAKEDEYYWVDLVGLNVINQQGEALGAVDRLLATGANDVLVAREASGHERYIPYIDGVIIEVDLENNKIIVDWDAAF